MTLINNFVLIFNCYYLILQKLDKFLNMEAEDYLEVSVDLERMNKNTNKDYWVSKCDEVVHGVCALLNTFGGKLCIKIENQNVVNLENILDNVLRATEQRLKQFMSLLRFNKLIKCRISNTNNLSIT